MDRKTFIDKIKTLFSEVEEKVEDTPVLETEAVEEVVETIEEKEEVVEDKEEVVEEVIEEEVSEVELTEEVSEEVTEEAIEEVIEEEKEEVNPLLGRIEALEKSISNLSESLSAIDTLQDVVSKIAGLPAEEEVKLSKASGSVESKLNDKESRLRFLSKRK